MAKTIVIDDETHKALREYADKNGTKLTWVISQAVKEWLKTRKK